MKNIYIELRTGTRVRDILEMGLLPRLLADSDIRVVILTPAYRAVSFRARYGQARVVIEKLPSPGLVGFQLLEAFMRIRARLGAGSRSWRAWLRMEPRLFYYRKLDRLFKQYPPALVIGTDLNNPDGAPLILRGQARGAPSLGLIGSWDHTYKPIYVYPDVLAVWSTSSKRQTIQLQGFREDQVHVVGAPQFDPYFEVSTLWPRDHFLQSLGLDPSRRTVMLTTIKPYSRVGQRFLVDDMLNAAAAGRFAFPVQFILRPHPGDNWAPYWAAYRDNPLVHLDWPGHWVDVLDWTPRRDDVRHMANLLCHSDVLVHVASTLVIEASIFDTPTVIAGYNRLDPAAIARRLDGRTFQRHFRPLLERDLTPIARSADELIEWINRFLEQPDLLVERRAELVAGWAGPLDGRAMDRTAELINRCLAVANGNRPA